MLQAPRPLPFDLPRRAMRTFDDGAGLAFTCLAGSVWVTVDGDPDDHVLEAGETFGNADHARVIVYAFEDSRVAVAPAIEAPAPSMLTRYSRNSTMATLSRFQPMPLTKAAR